MVRLFRCYTQSLLGKKFLGRPSADAPTADVERMIKSKIGERRTAKGFSGTVDDALVLDVIGAYRKQLQKALVEFEKVAEYGPGKAPDALVKIGLCHSRLRDASRAEQAWQRVIREYPTSDPAGLARSGYGAERLLGLLQRLGFRMYEVDEVECCVRRAGPQRLPERYPALGEGFTNLLFVRAVLAVG